jgi:rubrerythrin
MKSKLLVVVLVTISILSFSFALEKKDAVKTIENLKAAITGETTASAKYAAYAEKAKQEGYTNIALLFEAASKSENIHAGNHIAALEQLGETMGKVTPEFTVKSTKENLEDAINGESYEVATMYPEFIKTANDGKVNIALISFNYAYQTEKKHKDFYKEALDKLNNNQEKSLPATYYVCSTCGNTYAGTAPKRCGISMTPSERFYKIN